MRRSAPFKARAMSLSRPAALGSTSQIIWKLASGSTDPFLAGRYRTRPKEARTSYEAPKYLLIVLAFAGDSTMTIFMSFQWLTGKIKARFAGFAPAFAIRTWVQRRPLSNGQVVRRSGEMPASSAENIKIRHFSRRQRDAGQDLVASNQ